MATARALSHFFCHHETHWNTLSYVTWLLLGPYFQDSFTATIKQIVIARDSFHDCCSGFIFLLAVTMKHIVTTCKTSHVCCLTSVISLFSLLLCSTLWHPVPGNMAAARSLYNPSYSLLPWNTLWKPVKYHMATARSLFFFFLLPWNTLL